MIEIVEGWMPLHPALFQRDLQHEQHKQARRREQLGDDAILQLRKCHHKSQNIHITTSARLTFCQLSFDPSFFELAWRLELGRAVCFPSTVDRITDFITITGNQLSCADVTCNKCNKDDETTKLIKIAAGACMYQRVGEYCPRDRCARGPKLRSRTINPRLSSPGERRQKIRQAVGGKSVEK
jgi:hypothetical protein